MTMDDGVGMVILGLDEIVWKLEFSHKIEGVFALARVVTSPNNVPTYPIYRDQARRSF